MLHPYTLMYMSLGTCLNYSGCGDVRAAVATAIATALQLQQLLLLLLLFLLQLLLLLLLLLLCCCCSGAGAGATVGTTAGATAGAAWFLVRQVVKRWQVRQARVGTHLTWHAEVARACTCHDRIQSKGNNHKAHRLHVRAGSQAQGIGRALRAPRHSPFQLFSLPSSAHVLPSPCAMVYA